METWKTTGLGRLARRLVGAPTDPVSHSGHGGTDVSKLCYEDLSGGLAASTAAPAPIPLKSALCRQADFVRDGFRYWMAALNLAPRLHRKQWEFFYIAQALFERGALVPGRRGLGFGVGHEPLPALFAARGVEVLATDQAIDEAVRGGWAQSGQYTAAADLLNDRNICPADRYRKNVTFREVDMNNIPGDLAGRFDYCWSACCLEHLGSIKQGLEFIVASTETLRPGGLAVHTTEFNLTSNDDTIETRHLSLFRRRDIEAVIARLKGAGHTVEPIDLSTGEGMVDGYVDVPPYSTEPHLKLKIGAHHCTSLGLIITRGG